MRRRTDERDSLESNTSPWTRSLFSIGVCLLLVQGAIVAAPHEGNAPAKPAVANSSSEKPALRFDAKGQFKIVQITDTHWNEQPEKCRQTLEVLNHVLDQEKPDLAILTGDIVVLREAPLDGWRDVTEPLRRRKIPWAAVLGNHDDEYCGVSRHNIIKHLATMPYSLTEEGQESLGGTGNYILSIAGRDSKPAATIYCLDSHGYAYSKIRTFKRVEGGAGCFDWISFDQIQWYRQSSRALREAQKDHAIAALAFFHIPLQEYADPSFEKTVVGTYKEKNGCQFLNSGIFTAFLEEGDVTGVFVGHYHDSDCVGSLWGVCLGYGRCSGFGSYGKLPRGARIIKLTEGRREFESWIREGDGNEVHRFRTVDAAVIDAKRAGFRLDKNP
jgi:hypothetical protein